MSYVLKGSIAKYFRANGNEWSTSGEVAAVLSISAENAASRLSGVEKQGNLEVDRDARPQRYRVRPEKLYREVENRTGQKNDPAPSRRVARITRAFCKRHGVTSPSEATRRSPQALEEWCEMLRAG